MSNFYIATTSYGSTGLKTVTNSGFQPIGARITIGSKFGATASVIQQSVGSVDDTGYTTSTTIYGDASGFQTKTVSGANGKMISQYERVSGTLTEVVAATFDSFTTTGFKLNVSATSASYQLQVEMWD